MAVLENSNLVYCCMFVYGLPIVGPERIEKLKNVVAERFSFVHPSVSTFIPTDEDGKTKGYCFVEYETPAQTNAAAKIFYRHDTLSAYVLSAMRDLKEPEANWTPPTKNSYVDTFWIQSPTYMNQFAIENHTGCIKGYVFWNAKGQDPYIVSEDANRLNWSEFIFKWSPSGTCLASFHSQGGELWSGEKLVKVQKIQHPGVKYAEFSPNENYIATYAVDNTLRAFDVFTGELKKSFKPSGPTGFGRVREWPFLKWSHDKKYFAFKSAKGVSSYHAELLKIKLKMVA